MKSELWQEATQYMQLEDFLQRSIGVKVLKHGNKTSGVIFFGDMRDELYIGRSENLWKWTISEVII